MLVRPVRIRSEINTLEMYVINVEIPIVRGSR